MAWTITAPSGVGANLLPIRLSELVIDDSDKELIISTDLSATAVLWIDRLRIEYTAAADIGTRIIRVMLRTTADDVLYELGLNATEFDIAASASFVLELSPQAPGLLAAIGSAPARDWMPRFLLQPGDKFRVFDSAGIGVATDDMILHIEGRRVSA